MTANIICQKDKLMVSGNLNFSTAMLIWDQSLPLLAPLNAWHFDLSQVASSNSVGLALLIEWIKYAKKTGKQITFSKIPKQLNAIILAANMKHILKDGI